MPKISVILTVHNYCQFLQTAIESVKKQTYQDYELIIVNDGSSDYTEDIIYYLDHSRTKVIHNKRPLGLAGACNKGIKASSGEYIIRLDADDYFDRNILLVMSHILNEHHLAKLVYSDYIRVDTIANKRTYCKANTGEIWTIPKEVPFGSGCMYRRWCYDEIGGYDDSLRYQEHYDFWLRFLHKHGGIYYISTPLYYYMVHGRSMSDNIKERFKTRRQINDRFLKDVWKGEETHAENRKFWDWFFTFHSR